MIKSIFYTRFLLSRGRCVLHQVPEGSIVPEPATGGNATTQGFPSSSASDSAANASNDSNTLLDFETIADYVIPRQEFCDRLVTICVNRYCVLGYPVCIKDRRYERNEFIFSIALVLEEDADKSSYVSVVRKLGLLFRSLEEQAGFLSKEEDREREKAKVKERDGRAAAISAGKGYSSGISGEGKVYALCEMILEDLNNYCECMIPIDLSNTLNLKLFPARRPPPVIYGWHVPLSIVRLSSLTRAGASDSWDLTLLRIIPHIDGVASVSRISQLADADLGLTRKAVAHLVYYGCVILLDIFQFSAVYAPTADFGAFVESTEMQAECLRYVMVPWAQQRLLNGVGDGNIMAYEGVGRKAEDLSSRKFYRNNHDYGDNNGSDITLGSSYRSTTTITSLTHPTSKFPSASLNPSSAFSTVTSATSHPPSTEHMQYLLIRLYASLKQGLTLRNWCDENASSLEGIDVRRFITFGVIKGFLYRVQKYAIATGSAPMSSSSTAVTGKGLTKGRVRDRDWTEDSPLSPANAEFPFVVDDCYNDNTYDHNQRQQTERRNIATTTRPKQSSQHHQQHHNQRHHIDSDRWGQNISKKSIRSSASPPLSPSLQPSPSPSSSPSPSPYLSPSLHPSDDYLAAPLASQSTGTRRPDTRSTSASMSTARAKPNSAFPQSLPLPLARYLDGMHCFDQICTELEMAERDVLAKIKEWGGDVQLIYR